MYDVDFENPIASGLEVLFGGVNAYNAGWRRDISGYEPGPGSAPPFHGARSYAEPVIDEAGDQTSIDETGGYTY